MNAPIRRVGIAVVVLLLVLIGQLTYLQVVDADDLAADSRNSRTFLRDFTRPRGDIVSADGRILATSVPSDDEFELQRVYPLGALTSQIVGYQSIVVGSTGVERSYNSTLVGREARDIRLEDLGDLLLEDDRTGTVVLSLRTDAQALARDLLGDQRGSVVVVEPATGAIVAMYSNPSFDPTPLASHDSQEVQAYFDLLTADPSNPALPRAYRERYPPGSTFKVVTTEAALDEGIATPDRQFPTLVSLDLPQSDRAIANFGNSRCGGTLEEAFRRSCNTVFAQLGLELGERFPPRISGFGTNEAPPLDIAPGAVAGTAPTPEEFSTNQPAFALAGIGQGQVSATPLGMALVAAAVANGGSIMEPHVGATIRNSVGETVRTIAPDEWKRAMPPETAATIRDFMVGVVAGGTGRSAQIPGVTVAGKTGTAQCEGCRAPHAWFIAFAPAEAPRYAISVIVEEGGSFGDEATGGRIAAPIAAQMLRFLLGV